MSYLKKKPVEQIVSKATERLASDVSKLAEQKDAALNIFRGTINKTDTVNAELAASIEHFDSLARFASNQKEIAEKQLNENLNIRSKIVEIIGE